MLSIFVLIFLFLLCVCLLLVLSQSSTLYALGPSDASRGWGGGFEDRGLKKAVNSFEDFERVLPWAASGCCLKMLWVLISLYGECCSPSVTSEKGRVEPLFSDSGANYIVRFFLIDVLFLSGLIVMNRSRSRGGELAKLVISTYEAPSARSLISKLSSEPNSGSAESFS